MYNTFSTFYSKEAGDNVNLQFQRLVYHPKAGLAYNTFDNSSAYLIQNPSIHTLPPPSFKGYLASLCRPLAGPFKRITSQRNILAHEFDAESPQKDDLFSDLSFGITVDNFASFVDGLSYFTRFSRNSLTTVGVLVLIALCLMIFEIIIADLIMIGLVFVVITMVGSKTGMHLVRKWDTVTIMKARLKEDNKKRAAENEELTMAIDDLKKDLDTIKANTAELDKSVVKLNANIEQFGEIRSLLEHNKGDNESVNQRLDTLIGDMNSAEHMGYQCERANLMKDFFAACWTDRKLGMSKTDWDRFRHRIRPQYRREFDRLGDFDQLARGESVMWTQRFEEILDQVLPQSAVKKKEHQSKYGGGITSIFSSIMS